ncbi:putative ATP-dependent RNA helicase DDX4 isoform X1 [Brachionus plicatilis]|uniref:RNA helicase n=1 Tax=Brachionus plicatilis TaxID=10195 RepID=A0A3M7ST85_BRAPC|nr:putative ATP-dependent RNA helicase DDX4 isoform X1 [Brachionus plicatilis]
MEENWEKDLESETSISFKPKEENFQFSDLPKRPTGRGRPNFNKPIELKKPGQLDLNNNVEDEKQTFGFGKAESTELNVQKLSADDGEQKSFGSVRRTEESEENWNEFNKNDENSEPNERKGFSSFKRNNESENGERKPFQKFDNDRNFSRRNQENGDGENRGFKFGNRNENGDGERRSFNKGFGNRDGNENGDGERRSFNKGFGNRDRNENGDGERRSFNKGFGNRDGNENGDGERRSFNKGFGNRDRNENGDGERRSFNKGFGNRDGNENGDGERRSFNKGFGNRDRNENGDGERRSFNKGFGNRDENENGERGQFRKRDDQNGGFGNDANKGENEPAKKEKYIPTDVEETEETLFTTVAAGVNFNKQIEIKAELSGNGSEEIKPIMSFDEAKFSELLLENINKTKYKIPTAVQKYSIPIILQRRDLMACAQTGSGKTAAFVLPILKNILEDGIESSQLSGIQQPQALILSPTRELALQILHECKKFSHGSIIQTQILYGGVFFGYQMGNVEKGCNILVATPGRLLHVIESNKISLEKVKYFVLDEADRMLDMGFEKAVRDILEKGKVKEKSNRCTFMFSATFPDEIQRLAQDFLNDYLFLAVGQVGGANTDVEQSVYKVTKFEKRDKCIEILDQIGNERTMIFVEHKKEADVNAFFLIQKGYPATSIHGDRLQSQRESALREFKNGSKNILVCTAVAARGLDIEKVNHVINFDMPSTIDEYVHRIGRTGRCGNLGKSISFFDPENENDQKLARPLVRILSQAGQDVPEWLSSFSECSVGNSASANARATDLRSKFDRMSVESKPSAFSAPSAPAEEESWD